MSNLPTIAMFWTGAPITFVEELCIKSFLDAGHRTVVFSFDKIENLSAGVEVASASDVLPAVNIIRHKRTGSPALFSDHFRCKLLLENDGVIWADTDAYCLRPFEPHGGYLIAKANPRSVASGVMAMPANSPALKELISFFDDELSYSPIIGQDLG